MIDAYGRIKNMSQVIRDLEKLRLAYLFDDVKEIQTNTRLIE